MEKEKQSFDELYALVVHQIQLQGWYLQWEKKDAIWFTIFMWMLLITFLWIMSWDFVLAIWFIWPIFLFIILMSFIWFESEKIRYYKWIQELYSLTKWTDKKVEDYNEIITILKKLRKILTKKWNMFIWMGLLELEIRENQYNYFKMVQENISSDLISRIEKIKHSLQSAKSEVSKNIQWTTELDHVSELQKVRLNKQIEQFEALQKVLVKV